MPSIRAVILCFLASVAHGMAAQRTDAQRLGTLEIGTLEEKIEALADIRAVPMGQRSSAVLPALLGELNRIDRDLYARRSDPLSGQAREPREAQGDYLFRLIEIVSEYPDPAIIKPLLPFLPTGNMVVTTIARFGDRAVPDVAAFAAAGYRRDGDVPGALLTLRRIVERQHDTPITQASMRRIADVARERLRGNQGAVIVEEAIALAVATGDPELLGRVQVLATDRGEVARLGIPDPSLAARIQARAAAALAARERR